MPTRKIWNFSRITKIPFSGELPDNSVLRLACILNMTMDMDTCQIQFYTHYLLNLPMMIHLEIISNFHTLIKDFLESSFDQNQLDAIFSY